MKLHYHVVQTIWALMSSWTIKSIVAIMGGIVLILTGCRFGVDEIGIAVVTVPQQMSVATAATDVPRPTLTSTPQPTQLLTDSNKKVGLVTGTLCYPGSETPPMTLYLENRTSHEVRALDIKRGQRVYRTELPAGHYLAYADTVGMHLRSVYSCDGSETPCPFQVEAGQFVVINLCGWNSAPGLRPAAPGQPDGEVRVRLLQNMVARSGPHLRYPELDLLKAGSLVQAIGRSPDHEWLQVKHPSMHVAGWLHAPLTRIMGDPIRLPVISDLSVAREGAAWQFAPATWRSGANRGIVHFKGEIRDQAGQPVNGYSILLDNGTWSVLSHPSGASRHYPDVGDGLWDVVIDNETDATGWWTLTVIRYECPDFEKGFNAQCKHFRPLSETKVVKVLHPNDNVIEANWTCLENCDQGLYIKPYRKPVEPIRHNLLLYIEDRALKSSPPSPVFDRDEMRTMYDGLPDTPGGLRDYLAENRPRLSPDRAFLIVNAPVGVTWLADLETGDLRELGGPSLASTAWSPDSRQVAYIENNMLLIFDLATNTRRPVWRWAGLAAPTLSWSEKIRVKSGPTEWQISPTDHTGVVVEADMAAPPTAADLVTQKLPPGSAWALSHDGQKVAYSLAVGGPLRNEIYIFDVERQSNMLVGPINGYRVPEIRWTAEDRLLVIGATNPKFPSGGALFSLAPEANVLPEILLESDTAYLVDVIPE